MRRIDNSAIMLFRPFRRTFSTARASVGAVFDIDGVLIRGKSPLPGARNALLQLQRNKIPFIFLTNGWSFFPLNFLSVAVITVQYRMVRWRGVGVSESRRAVGFIRP
jgi:Haloacid dehalogenase-like hydrolase